MIGTSFVLPVEKRTRLPVIYYLCKRIMNMTRIAYILTLLLLPGVAMTQTVNQTDANGRKQGKWVKNYENTTIVRYTGQFKNGKPYGKFKYNYESGKLKAVSRYAENGVVCRTSVYHENGYIMAAGKYVNQKRDSIWLFFDDREALSMKETFVNGKQEGKSYVFYLDGSSSEETTYKKGVKNGPWVQYFEGGAVKAQGTYVDGYFDGQVNYFHPNGRKQMVGYYKHAVQNGYFKTYNEEGKEVGKTFYYNGEVLEGKELKTFLEHRKKLKAEGKLNPDGTLKK
jgi:antitoxin component YwqK of YwqJK toxin-antitoxin module